MNSHNSNHYIYLYIFINDNSKILKKKKIT